MPLLSPQSTPCNLCISLYLSLLILDSYSGPFMYADIVCMCPWPGSLPPLSPPCNRATILVPNTPPLRALNNTCFIVSCS